MAEKIIALSSVSIVLSVFPLFSICLTSACFLCSFTSYCFGWLSPMDADFLFSEENPVCYADPDKGAAWNRISGPNEKTCTLFAYIFTVCPPLGLRFCIFCFLIHSCSLHTGYTLDYNLWLTLTLVYKLWSLFHTICHIFSPQTFRNDSFLLIFQ